MDFFAVQSAVSQKLQQLNHNGLPCVSPYYALQFPQLLRSVLTTQHDAHISHFNHLKKTRANLPGGCR
jgi:hypothetical protein